LFQIVKSFATNTLLYSYVKLKLNIRSRKPYKKPAWIFTGNEEADDSKDARHGLRKNFYPYKNINKNPHLYSDVRNNHGFHEVSNYQYLIIFY